jgi:adenylate kinase
LKIVVFFGPPGAGKGTQASLLSKEGVCTHISTGSVLREEMSLGTSLGLRVKDIVDSGRLVDDGTLFQALKETLQRSVQSGKSCLALDGVPRTLSQIDLLDAALKGLGLKVDAVLHFAAPLASLVSRFSRRWTCRSCNTIFALAPELDSASHTCSHCGAVGTLYRRPDDAPEAVSRRFEVYERETLPILAVYEKRGLVRNLDGLRPEAEVAAEVKRLLATL